jgi:hypothetical protein
MSSSKGTIAYPSFAALTALSKAGVKAQPKRPVIDFASGAYLSFSSSEDLLSATSLTR